MDRTHPDVNDEEACIRVYLDIIQVCGASGLFFYRWSTREQKPHVFTHQLAEGTPRSAETLSSSLAAELQDLSFAELLSFLQRWGSNMWFFFRCFVLSFVVCTCRYFDEQTETLKKKTKMEESEMVYFLKTLKTCTEIKWVTWEFL